jgi:hypothetical protein
MHSTIHVVPASAHLSRHERQRLARADAFSRRTLAARSTATSVRLAEEELELIDRLVRGDRTPVSTALLVIAGIGAGEVIRQAVHFSFGALLSWPVADQWVFVRTSR